MKVVSTFIGLMFLAAPLQVFALPNTCECVRYLREVHGVNIKGDAWSLKPNLSRWNVDVGDVLLLQYGKVSHAALIIGFEWEEGRQTPTHFWIVEGNYKRCQVTSRKIKWEDGHIRGIFSPPPVVANI